MCISVPLRYFSEHVPMNKIDYSDISSNVEPIDLYWPNYHPENFIVLKCFSVKKCQQSLFLTNLIVVP
jgi:hypothetical protein